MLWNLDGTEALLFFGGVLMVSHLWDRNGYDGNICVSLICFIITCRVVLEYQVCSATFAFLKAPRCLVIQDCENRKDLVRAAWGSEGYCWILQSEQSKIGASIKKEKREGKIILKARCNGHTALLSQKPILLKLTQRKNYLSTYLDDELHAQSFLKITVAQRPDYFMCMTAAAGSVPLIAVGDDLSIF